MRPFHTLALMLLVSSYSLATVPDRVTAAIDSSQMVRLAGNIHMKAQPEFDYGVVDPEFKLDYMTLLTLPTPSQQKALDRLLAEQQNPASANYRKWLTQEQYAERFGLSQGDLNRITNWLNAQGFTVMSVARGRNWITFCGTAGQVANAFHTEIHQFNVDGQLHFANATALSVPAALAGVVSGVRGLHDFRMKPMGIRKRLAPDFFDLHFNTQFIAPGDIATIYDIKPLYAAGIDGTGQSIAVIGQTDIFLADLNFFRAGFGLSTITGCTTRTTGTIGLITACDSPNFKYVLVGTDPGVPSPGDLAESDLDLEWSGAVARNAQIIFVNAETAAGVVDGFYSAIDNQTAPVISLSYGICELGESPFIGPDETELKKANSLGITFVNSSGDSGSAACDNSTNPATGNLAVFGLAVSWPASSPEATGVGGSAVPFDDFTSAFWKTTTAGNGPDGGSALGYVPEEAWNDDAEFAAFCAANPTNRFCTAHGITSQATAQAALGIGIAGGGASNCATTSGNTCTGGFPQPAYQTVTVPGQASARFVPDVALLATPNFPGYIFCTPLSELGGVGSTSTCANGILSAIDTNLSIIGGTSASAPVFAGMVALLNQNFQGTSAAGLGNINPMLYELAQTTPNNYFHSLTAGNNQVFCVAGDPPNQPVALQCPKPPATAVIGFDASNADPVSGYNLVNGLGSVDLNNLVIAWAAARTLSTTALAAAPKNVVLGQNVTLTATVTPATAVGAVNFFNNGSATALGTGTLNSSGVATFQTTSLPIGTNHITATFNGDGANAPSSSGEVVVTVVSPDFTWTSSDPAHTVKAGQTTAAYNFTATPLGSTTFAADITFSCSGLPDSTAACVFNTGQTDPTKIAAGSGATAVALTITTKGPNTGTGAALQHRADKRSPWLPLTLPIAGIVMVGLAGRKVSKYWAAGLCLSLALLGLLIACGGSNPPVSLTVSPSTAVNLFPNNAADGWPAQTQTFTASVSNTSNTAVTWSVSPSGGGTIDANGVYIAPTLAAGLPATVTVRATSQADSSKSATGTVNIQTPTTLGTFTVTVTATEAQTQKSPSVTLTVQ
jgi:Pro-kumamolisin, activation domain/Bacterial Ig-like domain (group 3)